MSYNQRLMTLNSVLSRAWEVSKEHWGVLVGITLVGSLIGQIPGSAISQNDKFIQILALAAQGKVNEAEAIEKSLATYSPDIPTAIIAILLSIFLSSLVYVVTFKYIKQILDDKSDVDFTQLLKESVKIVPMAFVKILIVGIACSIASCLCLLPGLYLGVRLLFVPYISANSPQLTIEETLKKSWNMTNGRFFQLLGYGIVACLIAMSGYLACCVGIFFTMPLAYVMLGEAYNEILEENGELEYEEK